MRSAKCTGRTIGRAESTMVALRGFGPNSIFAWLREMDMLRQALEVAAAPASRARSAGLRTAKEAYWIDHDLPDRGGAGAGRSLDC